MERFVAFDVETPNYYNDRMSSIGIAVIENGQIVDSFSSLVDPESHFDAFNISLTGITPELVETAPTFPELWAEIGETMLSGILVAHNATFDMRVLSSCLMHYEIDVPRTARFLCTVTMGRKCYPTLRIIGWTRSAAAVALRWITIALTATAMPVLPYCWIIWHRVCGRSRLSEPTISGTGIR